jgi:phage terminase large subunit GpA-like protein
MTEKGIAGRWYYTVKCPKTDRIFSVGEAPEPDPNFETIAEDVTALCPHCLEEHTFQQQHIQVTQAKWKQ